MGALKYVEELQKKKQSGTYFRAPSANLVHFPELQEVSEESRTLETLSHSSTFTRSCKY